MDDELRIRKVVENLVENPDLNIIELLPFVSRVYLMNNKWSIIGNEVIYNNIKYNLFTPDEAIELKKHGYKTIEVLYHLSDEEKMELFGDGFFSPEEYCKLFESLSSDDTRKIVLKKILGEFYIGIDYVKCFDDINNAIDIIDEYLSENSSKANDFLMYKLCIPENLKSFDISNQHRFIDLFNKYNCFGYGFFRNIDDNLDVFMYVIKLPSVKNSVYLYNYIEDLKPKEKIDANYVYDMLISNGYELKNDWMLSLFNIVDENKEKEFFNHIYGSIKGDNLIVANLLSKYPKKMIPQKLIELFSGDKRFNVIEIACRFKNDLLFNCFDIICEKYVYSSKYYVDEEKLCKRFMQHLDALSYDIHIKDKSLSSPNFIRFMCDQLNLNQVNFEKMISRFGYQTFKYLSQEKIKKFINFDEDEFDMIMKIFSKENTVIDNHKMDSLIESVVQREFIFKYSDIYNIFSRFEILIRNKEDFKGIYDNVISVVSTSRLNALQKICFDNNITLEQLFINLQNDDSRAIGILHSITNLYISIKREEYAKGRIAEIKDELYLHKRYQKEWILKKYIEISGHSSIYVDIKCLNPDDLNDEQRKLYNDREQLYAIIDFKKNPQNSELRSKVETKNLNIFTELLNMLYEKDKLKDSSNDPNAKYVYSFNSVKPEFFLEVLSSLDFDCIRENLLSNTDAYEVLLNVFEKHRYMGIGNTFYPIRDNIDLDIGAQSIAGLINCFYVLYNDFCNKALCDDKLMQRLANGSSIGELFLSDSSMTRLLEEGYVHEMASNKYSFLLGQEDFRLIFANVGKNRSTATSSSRLNKVIDVIPKMYERTTLSVPSINDVITLENGKKVDVIIGSVDFMNLSVGERTKACLRACGAFKDLWEFCLTNKNGFNIIFLDHETGKFISRVSAVRNGNTVFENELRESVCAGFTNDDVVFANNIVSNMLVSMTKDDEYPIDNVFITSDYAMKEYENQRQNIEIDRKKALYNLSFNYGTGDSFPVVVLSNEGSILPITLENEKLCSYDVHLSRVSLYYGSDIIKKIKQLHAINDLLNGVSMADMNIIDVSYDLDNLVCIANNQFYVIKHGDEVIDSFILDKCRDNEKVVCGFERAKGGFSDEKNRSNRQL